MRNTNEPVRGHAEKDAKADKAARLSERAEAAHDAAIACAEHLTRDFARVRARLGMDPVLAPRSLAAAWTTDVMEEDEAEFVDAVADCMGAGLSLESALTGWDIGTLVVDDEDSSEDDATAPPLVIAVRQPPRGNRRVYVR
ncbi:MAG TPA: hypothetical protein VGP07_15275 [Polyangia bacterium]|jgi:hypothetical protein